MHDSGGLLVLIIIFDNYLFFISVRTVFVPCLLLEVFALIFVSDDFVFVYIFS
jgi:hypothetical protein